MAELPTYFNDFLCDIRPTENQESECQDGHTALRKRLDEYDDLKKRIVDHFLQGSYERSTAIKPPNNKKLDVDIVVVTNLNEQEFNPQQAFDLFKPFLEKYYKGKYKQQGRSWGIELSYVDLDFVITSAPSEVKSFGFIKRGTIQDIFSADEKEILKLTSELEEWKVNPLRIPDRDLKIWENTNPLEQIKWTIQKNRNCNGHYINLVKAIKWWRINKYPEQEYPKSYPLEHIVGDCCPDGIDSIAKGVVLFFENVISKFAGNIQLKKGPFLKDHGTDQNVLKRLSFEDFKAFYEQSQKTLNIARKAYNESDPIKSANLWYEIFGEPFPKPDDKGGYTPREKGPTKVGVRRFA